MVNRLAHAQSACLQQHATNPVHWWERGEEALSEAARRDVGGESRHVLAGPGPFDGPGQRAGA
ncbi:DUF255 domain-containing protein [Streptomyces rubellomurinus]|uniref:DUF255 domain-containing protein n=1 Tax=Streptomyces sp. Y1 TaxID=3238634 RepID=A0AB39TCR7_9ACTN